MKNNKYCNVWKIIAVVRTIDKLHIVYITAYIVQSDCLPLPNKIAEELRNLELELVTVQEIINCREIDDIDYAEGDYIDKMLSDNISFLIQNQYKLNDWVINESDFSKLWVFRLNLEAVDGYYIHLLVNAKRWQFPPIAGTIAYIITRGSFIEVFKTLIDDLNEHHFKLITLIEMYNVHYSLEEVTLPQSVYKYAKDIINTDLSFVICKPYFPYDIHNIP